MFYSLRDIYAGNARLNNFLLNIASNCCILRHHSFSKYFFIEKCNPSIFQSLHYTAKILIGCSWFAISYCKPGHNILELFNNLVQVRITISKTTLDI